MQQEVPLRNQRYQEGCYQNQIYQPMLEELSPTPTAWNIFLMRCWQEYNSFTQREMRPILVYLHRGSHGLDILQQSLIPWFAGTQTRLLVVDVDKVPEVAYNYRNVVQCYPALLWTFRGKVFRVLTDFRNPKKVLGYALSGQHARNRGMNRTSGGT